MGRKIALLFTLLFFTIIAANAKAKKSEPLNIFGVGVNIPFLLEYASEQRTSLVYQPNGRYTYSGRINGVGVDLYGSHIASSGFGFIADVSINFPLGYSYREKSNGWERTKKFRIADEWNPFFIIDLCVVPMYYFIRTDVFYLGLGPQFGLSFGYADSAQSFKSDNLMSIFGLGVGANLSLMYRFSTWVGTSFGVKAMYWAQLADQPIITNANGTFEITPFVCASFILPKK